MDSIRRAIGRRSSLWNNADFLYFWIGETIANFGGQLGLIALPLIAAITLGASPFQMGLLAASSSFPRMIVGIFAGTWVDRRKRRPIMIGINLTRATTLMVIPVAALMGMLTFPLLLIVAVLLGIQGIIFDSAWSAMVPTLVERKVLADANGKLWASMSLAQITGPALAGTLIAWLTGPNVLALTSISLMVAAWYVKKIRTPEPEPKTDHHGGPKVMIQHIREGYAELVQNPVVRPLTTTMIGIGFGTGIYSSAFVLFLTSTLGLSTRNVGLVYAVGGFGALIGSMVAAPWARKWGYGPVILWGSILQGLACLILPFSLWAGSLEVILVTTAAMTAWIFFQAYDINRFSLRQAITPPHLMGRVASSTMTLMAAANMIGALIGGTIGQVYGIRVALFVSAVIMTAASYFTWKSTIPGIIEMPEGQLTENLVTIEEEPEVALQEAS